MCNCVHRRTQRTGLMFNAVLFVELSTRLVYGFGGSFKAFQSLAEFQLVA